MKDEPVRERDDMPVVLLVVWCGVVRCFCGWFVRELVLVFVLGSNSKMNDSQKTHI